MKDKFCYTCKYYERDNERYGKCKILHDWAFVSGEFFVDDVIPTIMSVVGDFGCRFWEEYSAE